MTTILRKNSTLHKTAQISTTNIPYSLFAISTADGLTSDQASDDVEEYIDNLTENIRGALVDTASEGEGRRANLRNTRRKEGLLAMRNCSEVNQVIRRIWNTQKKTGLQTDVKKLIVISKQQDGFQHWNFDNNRKCEGQTLNSFVAMNTLMQIQYLKKRRRRWKQKLQTCPY